MPRLDLSPTRPTDRLTTRLRALIADLGRAFVAARAARARYGAL